MAIASFMGHAILNTNAQPVEAITLQSGVPVHRLQVRQSQLHRAAQKAYERYHDGAKAGPEPK